MQSRKLALRWLAAIVATGSVAAAAPASADALPELRAQFVLERDLGGSYEGRFEVRNAGGSPAAGWSLAFDLPPGQAIVSGAEGVDLSVGGRHVVTSQSWNARVSPGATVAFSLRVSYSGEYSPPGACTIDGVACDEARQAEPVASAGAWGYAPYVEMAQGTDLAGAMAAGGMRFLTLESVVSGGPCEPAWDESVAVGAPADDVDDRIAAVRAAGGDVIVSFGGEAGADLARTCESVDQLAAQYARVVGEYGLSRVDFDIDAAALGDDAANARRAAAVQKLQEAHPAVAVSFTLPASRGGLTQDGLDLLTGLRDAGVSVGLVNIRTMNFGGTDAPDPHGNMGEYAIQAAAAAKAQVKDAFSLWNDAVAWSRLGVTPMAGENDVLGEVFDLHDAKQLTEFASRVGLGRLSMRSVERDRPCALLLRVAVSPSCSGIGHEAGAFSRIFSRYKADGVDQRPVADGSVRPTLDEDTSHVFHLPVSDPDGDALEYFVLPPPSHTGDLFQVNPDGTRGARITLAQTYARVADPQGRVLYKPPPNQHSGDLPLTFLRFFGRDRSRTSLPEPPEATRLLVFVRPVNDPPSADANQSVAGFNDVPVTGVFPQFQDVDGDQLTGEFTSLPENGRFYRNGVAESNLITPASNEIRPSDNHYVFVQDQPEGDCTTPRTAGVPYTEFSFRVFDGEYWSGEAKVTINIFYRNEPPQAVAPFSVDTFRDRDATWHFEARDPDSPPSHLRVLIRSLPKHGSLLYTLDFGETYDEVPRNSENFQMPSQEGSWAGYRPDPGYVGPDDFVWEVLDPQDAASRCGPTTTRIEVKPPENGKIAFTSLREGNHEIHTMNPDGSEPTRITSNGALDETAAWSPDGRRIAFVRRVAGNYDVYVMNADGSGENRLTDDPAEDRKPAWSADGTRIAFTSKRDGNEEIYVMDADGSAETNVTREAAADTDPAWSPDGRRIAFTSFRGGKGDVWVMQPDGTAPTRLTDSVKFDGDPSWSPDGRRIAFQGSVGGGEIFVMNADGSDRTNLTNNSAIDSEPAWSPDGRRIAFTSFRDLNSNVYVMDADGAGQTRLTDHSALDASPAWQPLLP